jgi:hypothetical protein
MERLDKIKLAIEKGITCDPITGKVYGVKGKEIERNIKGYIKIGITKDKKQYNLSAHQFIFYVATGKIVDCIDHINGIKTDNRINNLRSVTNQQNTFNTKAKGFHKKGEKYQSEIQIDGKIKYLGYFETEQEARQAYLDAKKIYHNI